ncbi:hypothetical protein YC2023_056173 [Brassica napus]
MGFHRLELVHSGLMSTKDQGFIGLVRVQVSFGNSRKRTDLAIGERVCTSQLRYRHMSGTWGRGHSRHLWRGPQGVL